MSGPTLSVVVPTYNRGAILARTLLSLLEQDAFPGSYEVVVIVDGSADGTLELLDRFAEAPALRVVAQANRGLAAARNRGIAEARGGVALFLDDDMIASRNLVRIHQEAHSAPGERVVFGSLALAPTRRRSFLKQGVEEWGDELAQRLASPGYRFRFDDCHFGHASVTRSLFERAGGFDESFTRFGNEDYDLGWRLIQMGAEMRFASLAMASQIYDKGLFRWLSDIGCVGRADVALARKHPSLSAELRFSRRERHPLKRLARAASLLSLDPLAPAWGLLAVALAGMECLGLSGTALQRAQSLLGERQYWRGVREARRRDFFEAVRVEPERGRVA